MIEQTLSFTRFNFYKKIFPILTLFFFMLVSEACSSPTASDSLDFFKVQDKQVFQRNGDTPFMGSGRILLVVPARLELGIYEVGSIINGKLSFTLPKELVISGTPIWQPVYSNPADRPGFTSDENIIWNRTVKSIANVKPDGAQWLSVRMMYDDLEDGEDDSSHYWKYLVYQAWKSLPSTDNNITLTYDALFEFYYCDRAASVSGMEEYIDTITFINISSTTKVQNNGVYHLDLVPGWNSVYTQLEEKQDGSNFELIRVTRTNTYSTSVSHVNAVDFKWRIL